MNGLILALCVSTGGIESTWERTPDGELVYVVQLDDQAIAALKQGYPITSAIPAELRGVKSIRLQYGTTPLQKPALPEPQVPTIPQGGQSPPFESPPDQRQWTSNNQNDVALISAPPQDGGTLSPAQAFQQSQSGGNIQYPDRRRPMQATVAGSPQVSDTQPSLARSGTFGGTTNSGQASPTGTDAAAARDLRNTYPGESLLQAGQNTAIGPPPGSTLQAPGTAYPGPASQQSSFDPNLYAQGGQFPDGQVRIPYGANDPQSTQQITAPGRNYAGQGSGVDPRWAGTAGQYASQQTQPSYQTAPPYSIGAPPLLGAGGNGSVPGQMGQGNGYTQVPYTGGFDPRVANSQNNYGHPIQPVPASNQPVNNYIPTLPTSINQTLAGRESTDKAWWNLTNKQNSSASSQGGSQLASKLNQQAKFTPTSTRSGSSTATREKQAESPTLRDAEVTPGDNNVATLGLLFLSMGLNVYMGYLLRGFYIKTRQLARDLRETIATV